MVKTLGGRLLSLGVGLFLFTVGAGPLRAADEAGFQPMFDGKTLAGWDGNPKFWRVEDGTIVGQTTKEVPTPGNTFLIWTGGKPADFDLRAEFKLTNHNSGIQFRSWEKPDERWRVLGYQADMDGSEHWTGGLYGEGYRGVLAVHGQKVVIGENHKPTVVETFGDEKTMLSYIHHADWNTYEIIARGNHIIQKVNGHLTIDATDEDAMARKDGIIALQLHANQPMKVQFRNLRLKTL